jgi:WD40 repeat protein
MVSLFDLATSEEIEQLPALGTNVSAIAYSPDGTLLVSGGENGTIRVWSCAERRLVRELDGHKKRIGLLRFRADGRGLLSIDSKGTVIWWDVATWEAGQSFSVELLGKPETIWRWPDVSPDGRLLALGTRTGAMRWLNADTGELLEATSGDASIWLVAFSGDGLQVASTSNHGSVALWDPTSFTWVTSFRAHLMAAHGVAFSPDGRRLATGGAMNRDAVRLWDLSTRRELLTLPGQCAVSGCVTFSRDGRWLAACGRGSELNLWRAPSWEEIEAAEKSE